MGCTTSTGGSPMAIPLSAPVTSGTCVCCGRGLDEILPNDTGMQCRLGRLAQGKLTGVSTTDSLCIELYNIHPHSGHCAGYFHISQQ